MKLTSEGRVMKIVEAALLVDRRSESIFRAIRNGRIKAVRAPNGDWMVDRESLLRYVRSPRSKATKAICEAEEISDAE